LLNSRLKGFLLTVNTLGLSWALRETIRRVFGISYTWRDIQVDSTSLFRLLRKLVFNRYDVYGSRGEVVVKTCFGEISVDMQDHDLLNLLSEPFEEMYGYVDVDGRVVVDIGAYIGETALYFIHKGARRVYAFEPVEKFFRYLLKNISRNNLEGKKIIAFNYGAWFRDMITKVNINGSGTGLRVDYSRPCVELSVRSLKDIIEMVYDREGVIDLVKMDCEGCEYSLLRLDEELLRLPKQYIIEIHGAELPIIDLMTYNGFKAEKMLQIRDLVNVYFFKKE